MIKNLEAKKNSTDQKVLKEFRKELLTEITDPNLHPEQKEYYSFLLKVI